LKSNEDSTKQLRWMYGTRKSKLFETNIHSVYNRLIATVEYVDGTFLVTTQHKTDLATDEHINAHCEATIRSMERWLADEIAKKLT
jgi:hypothetical protein